VCSSDLFMIVLIMSIVFLRTSSRSKVDAARMLPICFIDSISRSRLVTEQESVFFSIASERVGASSSTFSVWEVRAPGRTVPMTRSPVTVPPIFSGTRRQERMPGLTMSSCSSGCCIPSV